MNHISTRLTAFLCASVCAAGAMAETDDAAKAKGLPAFGQLAPVDLQTIQGLGHAVLAAQQGATPDPAQEALRNDMKALGVALDQGLAAILTTPPKLQLGKGRTVRALSGGTQSFRAAASNRQYQVIIGPDGQVTQQEVPSMLEASAVPETAVLVRPHAPQETSAGDEHFAAVRGRLAAVRQRTGLPAASSQPYDEVRSVHTATLLSKSSALHDELEAALAAPSADNASRLANLRERLRPKTLPEVLAERQAADRQAGESIPEPTPTISTITRHR